MLLKENYSPNILQEKENKLIVFLQKAFQVFCKT